MEKGSIEEDNKRKKIIKDGDVLRRIKNVRREEELIEEKEIWMLGEKGKKKIGKSGKEVIGDVIDKRRKVRRRRKD